MSQINYKKYIHDYAGDGFGGVKKIIFFEEAWRRYSEELKTWLQDIVVPRKDKTIQVEVLYGYPQMPSALRSATSQQEKPDVNKEFSQKLVDLREDRTKIPIIGYYISTITYDQSRELPGEIFYRGKYTDDSKKNIVMMNKEIPFILQYTLSVWTRQKSDMYYIHQQILSRFNPNVVFFIDNQEIPVRLDTIVDTSSLESAGGAYQLIRNDIVITMDAWMKRNAVTVRTIHREKVVYSEKVVTEAGEAIGPSIVNFIQASEDFTPISGGAEIILPPSPPTLYLPLAGDQIINLTWTTVADASGYVVKFGTTSHSYSTSIDVGNNTSYQITGLTNGVIYYIAVSAYKYGLGRMTDSNEQSATPYVIIPPVPLIWPSSLLLHFSSNVDDSSAIPKTITNNGVIIDINVAKFSTGSAYFNGSAYLTVPNTGLIFGSNDFTIDFWYKYADTAFYQAILATDEPNANRIHLFQWQYDSFNSGAYAQFMIQTYPESIWTRDNAWHHSALVRYGDVFTAYNDGVAVGSNVVSGDMPPGGVWQIGRNAWDPAYFIGWLDEFHVVVGAAVWKTNFIPPTAPYNS